MAVFHRITRHTPGDCLATAEILRPIISVRAVDSVTERLLPWFQPFRFLHEYVRYDVPLGVRPIPSLRTFVLCVRADARPGQQRLAPSSRGRPPRGVGAPRSRR